MIAKVMVVEVVVVKLKKIIKNKKYFICNSASFSYNQAK